MCAEEMESKLTNDIEEIDLIGCKLSLLDQQQLLQRLSNHINSNDKILILSGNVYSFNTAYEETWYREFFQNADYVRLDGAGLRLGAKILGYDTPNRMTWADFAWELAEICEAENFSVFLLGARPGVANKAADELRNKYPNLRFAGIQHGYFNKDKKSDENKAVIDAINIAKPDILIIGFGMPLQEMWLKENWVNLDVKVTFTGGAVFDYISGDLQRAPQWMTEYGMEWLGRLLIEPRRLWRRYIIGNPVFLWRVLKQKIKMA